MAITVITMYIYIHQPWEKTHKILSTMGADVAGQVTAATALLLVNRAHDHKNYQAMAVLLNTIHRYHIASVVDTFLSIWRDKFPKHTIEITRTIMLRDKSQKITQRLVTLLNNQTRLDALDIANIVAQDDVSHEHFAILTAAILSNEDIHIAHKQEVAFTTGCDDIAALKRNLRLEKLQRAFLDLFARHNLKPQTWHETVMDQVAKHKLHEMDIDSAWKVLESSLKCRHKAICDINEVRIFAWLERDIPWILPKVLTKIIAEYATETLTSSTAPI